MAQIKTLSCDIETFSSVDLAKSGVYRYAEAPDFEILLFGYSVDGGEVRVVDLTAGEAIPAEVLDALTDDSVIKTAHNSNFERVCLSRYLSDLGVSLDPFHDAHPMSTECARFLNPAGWHCTMVWAAYMGLPLSLADTGTVLGLERQKLSEGKDLIRYFCKPCEPTKTNGGRTRNRPGDAPEKWEMFKAYNLRDVETEMEIEQRLARFPVPEDVWDQFHIDQEINDRGIAIDGTLVENAIRMDTRSRDELTTLMREMTQLSNPNSVQQMKRWLVENGMEIDSLGKKQVQALLKDAPHPLREVLLLRQQLAKSSVKKYIAMKNAVCADGRVRGMFQFYGAVRSGRWAGRLVQLQNLYRNSMPDLESARNLVREGDYDTVKMLYGAVPDVLAELVRTAFIPRAGQKFIVSDFSAVEARVIAWLAGEQWRMDVFRDGGDIYCASASQMFKVLVEKHGVNGHLRQKGKIAELALGYERCVFNMLEDDYGSAPEIITLSPEADALMEAFSQELEPKLVKEYAEIADWCGKLAGNTLRIAGLLCRAAIHRGHDFLDVAEPLVVDGQTMANAIRLGKYFLNHAQAIFNVLPENAMFRNAHRILKMIYEKGLKEFNRRTAMRNCQTFKRVEEIQPVLDFLEDYGYIAPVEAPPTFGKGRPAMPKYIVNPWVEQYYCHTVMGTVIPSTDTIIT